MRGSARGFVSVGGFKNVALLYELDFDEERDTQLQRRDLTLLHDDFERAIRYTAGDIRPSITAFQTSVDLLGVGVERNYGQIQPFRNLRPGGRTRFELERSARVTFEVNGRVVQTLDLEPGAFDISDFPLVTGFNDVRVLVDDEFGQREVGNYSTYVDTALLGSGVTLYGANVGVRRDRTQDGFGYGYGKKPLALGFYETGLTDKTTLGAQLEVSEDGGYIGGRALQAIGESVLGVEVGLSDFAESDDNDGGSGTAIAATWTWRPEDVGVAGWELNRARIAAEHVSDGFQSLGNNGRARPEQLNLAAQASFNRGSVGFGIAGGYGESGGAEIYSTDATLRFPVRKLGANLSLGYQYQDRRRDDNRETDHRVLLTVSRNFGQAGTVRFRGATNPDLGELEWRRNSSRSIGTWGARAAYRVGEEGDELGLDANWVTPFAEFDARHKTQAGSGFGSVDSSVTDFRIGIGAGFADGALAFGRPVADGFAIATPHSSLNGHVIQTRAGRDRVSAASSPLTLGPNLLIPLTGSYREQIHDIDVEDLPIGYDIGAGRLEMFPSVNSGYRVEVGSEPGVMVIGKLFSGEEAPLALISGRLEQEGAEPIAFFTNRTGRFVAENTRPGTYDIIIDTDESLRATLEVTEGEDGVMRAGNITLEDSP